MAKSFDEQFKDYYEKNKGEHDTETDIKAKEINYKDYFNQKLQNANLRALSQKYFRANMENSGLLGTGEMVSANLRNDQYYNNLDNANFENMQAKNNAITQQGITNYENGLNADVEKYIGYMQQYQDDRKTLDNILIKEGLLNEDGSWNEEKAALYGADRMQDLKTQYSIASGDIQWEFKHLSNGVKYNAEDGGQSVIDTITQQTIGEAWANATGDPKNATRLINSSYGVRDEVKTMVKLVNEGSAHDGQIFYLKNDFYKQNPVQMAFLYKNGSFYRLLPSDVEGKQYTLIQGGKVK